MTLQEAIAVADAVYESRYPATNPQVLARALVTLYAHAERTRAGFILDWMCDLGYRESRTQTVIPPQQHSAVLESIA